jgi:hypothetical protein
VTSFSWSQVSAWSEKPSGEGTPAARPASGRTRPAPRYLDAFELQDVERCVRDGLLLLENAGRTQQREGAPGHGDGERLHLGVGGPRQRMQAQLRLVHLLEDGLGDEEVEVGRQLERRAEALDEGHGAGEWPGHPEPPGRPPLEGEERPDEEAQHVGEEPGIPG